MFIPLGVPTTLKDVKEMSLTQHIVVGVDPSKSSAAAVRWGACRAERLRSELILVHAVLDFEVPLGKRMAASGQGDAPDFLAAYAQTARELAPSAQLETRLATGEPSAVLAELSTDADLVVVGTDRTADVHGEGFGVVNLQLALMSKCPVAVIPTYVAPQAFGVVVGIDGSANSLAAADLAATEAEALGQDLTVVYAPGRHHGLGAVSQDETHGQAVLEQAVAGLRTQHQNLAIMGSFAGDQEPVEALTRAGQTAQLLVVGSRGMSSVKHAIMGSVTSNLLARVPCPLVITRPVGTGWS